MNDRVIQFEEVQAHRVLGIQHGEGFTLKAFSPGVNLIHGPNGSGKSTTARIIQELLWPGRTGLDRPTVCGRFRNGEHAWWIHIDAGHAETSCDSQVGKVPELGPPENRHRYYLALHELIGDDNESFAKAIADASQGGYDLDGAAAELGFTERPSSPRKESRVARECRGKVEAARRHQRDIERAAGQLRDLIEKRDLAIAADEHIHRLETLLECHEVDAQCREIELQLDALPEGISKLRGDEREKLDQLGGRLTELERDLAEEQKRLDDAERALRELNIADAGVGTEEITTLRARSRRLDQVESDIRQNRHQLTMANTAVEKARQRIGDHLSDEQLVALDTVEVEDLTVFARRADQLRARQAVLDERRRSLQVDEPEEVRGLNAQTLREGLTALSHWLSSSSPGGRSVRSPWWPVLTATLMIAVLGVTLAVVQHGAWLALLLVAGAVAAWEAWLRRSVGPGGSTGVDTRGAYRRSYEVTGLAPPESWEEPNVAEQVRVLAHLTAVCESEDQRLRQLERLQPETEELQREQDELNQQRQRLEEQLGVKLEITNEWLLLLIESISHWQRRSTEAEARRRALHELKIERAEVLAEINGVLQPFGYHPVDAAEAAARLIDDLSDRQARHRDAMNQRTESKRRIENSIQPVIEGLIEQRREMLDQLGLDEADEAAVDDWLTERPRFLELQRKLSEATAICDDRRKALAGHEHLLDLDSAELKQRIDDQRRIAETRDELSEQIAKIQSDIERAKAGHELSDALDDLDAAKDALRDAREQYAEAIVGGLLTKWVRTVAVERYRPEVFERANELLVRFSRGMLQLHLDDHANPPAFGARHGSEPPRPVEQLSAGERIQLLMAVRLAFLELDEPARLPLLLDEVLGTSDDDRAGVIIDTVIEIAREGRQVFYFTAQHDEVGKWDARLTAADIPHKVIDLGQVRQLSAASSVPLRITEIDVPQPPAPDGKSRDEYGHALNVPAIKPADEHLDRLHLWHLIDDVNVLYELLCRRITTWRQLRTLLEYGGEELVSADDRQLVRINAKAKAIKEACRAWNFGRGKPADRSVLLESDLVGENFIDEVTELAQQHGGNAEAVLRALDAGEVKYWRTERTEQLREHWKATGHIADDNTLTEAEVRARVLGVLATEVRDGLVDDQWLEQVIAQLYDASV